MMGRAVALARITGWSLLGATVAAVTALQVVVAGVLVVASHVVVWQEFLVGLAYIAVVCYAGVRVVTRRASMRRAALTLFALDVAMLPIAVAAFSM